MPTYKDMETILKYLSPEQKEILLTGILTMAQHKDMNDKIIADYLRDILTISLKLATAVTDLINMAEGK